MNGNGRAVTSEVYGVLFDGRMGNALFASRDEAAEAAEPLRVEGHVVETCRLGIVIVNRWPVR